eukprot:m.98937 g.98937  ORF g.98937 m.98937 type:complete len:123 (-) comp20596_c0_seq12:63-431(-)
MVGVDMGGGDYDTVHVPPGSDAHACQARCVADPKCDAWTQVIRGSPTGSADCIKKSATHAPPTPNKLCTSGCVQHCENRSHFGPANSVINATLPLKTAEVGVRLGTTLPLSTHHSSPAYCTK